MYNSVTILGNLTRDIELRYSQSGLAIANTAIASTHKYTSNGEKKEDTCFVDIVFFGRTAENANQYLRKGSKVLVNGRLNFDQWVDQNGQKRSKHSITVDTMVMVDSKNQGTGMNSPVHHQTMPQQGQYYNAPQQSYQPPQHQHQANVYQPTQQQQAYNQPNQGYNQPSQGYDNQAVTQSRTMPTPDSVPVIDIDEDEIPF